MPLARPATKTERAKHAPVKPAPDAKKSEKIKNSAAAQPQPAPVVAPETAKTGTDDLSGAVPLNAISALPDPAAEAQNLHQEIATRKPRVEEAGKLSARLSEEAAKLKQNLIDTAAKIEKLEDRQLTLSGNIARLSAENAILSRDFHADRGTVTRQLAMLERLQRNMPPAMVLQSGDVLKAARASMVMGATLPKIYQHTADLARRLQRIHTVRADLTHQRQEAQETARTLRISREKLNTLVAQREAQAATATAAYESLRSDYQEIADRAASLDTLLHRISTLEKAPGTRGWVAVESRGETRPHLRRPVSGSATRGGMDDFGGTLAPGVTYTSVSGAQVVAPGEARVRYAGPYQKYGLVLILEMANGYDAVLAGLGRVLVRTGERVLAGEPVGRLPEGAKRRARLYFELRHDGQGMNPARFIDAG